MLRFATVQYDTHIYYITATTIKQILSNLTKTSAFLIPDSLDSPLEKLIFFFCQALWQYVYFGMFVVPVTDVAPLVERSFEDTKSPCAWPQPPTMTSTGVEEGR